MKRTSRKPSNLSESLRRQLNSYSLAASAAGVGMLASAQASEAKIVYTPAHVVIMYNSYPLDLDNDGVVDFNFLVSCNCTSYHNWSTWLSAAPIQSNNQVWGAKGCASALERGKRIGPSIEFSRGKKQMVWFTSYNSSGGGGPWKNVTNRYLGLKFLRDRNIHYGWARLSVYVFNGFTATLTGYAYETVPNKPIIAGKTHGPDVIVKHGTLGELAAGRK